MHPLYVYNSLTRQQELFKPIRPPYVGMYVCGPTVYGPAHLGHARCYITFDIIQRYLKHLGYQVRYVRNITDVGHLESGADEGADKIIKQAQLENIEPMEVVQRYMHSYHKDMAALNVEPPHIEPQASGHIPEQIAIIQQIINHQLAYVVNGSVYFSITAYQQHYRYGKLSGRKTDDVVGGTRVLAGQKEKQFPGDFALWKKASPTHIMRWASPWGEGFPGWHTECTALATKYLGNRFDIHGGGLDLLFPHHECEIAQSEAAQDTSLAKYWLHNNLVTLHDQKMSKSLGNCITLEQLFQGTHPLLTRAYHPMILRFFLLQAHYRSTVSFSNHALQVAEKGFLKLINGLKTIENLKYIPSPAIHQLDQTSVAQIDQHISACYEAMNEDFNTAKLIAELFQLLKFIHGLEHELIFFYQLGEKMFEVLKRTYILFVKDILGLQPFYQASQEDFISTIITIYEQAKQQKNYTQIDMLRAALKKKGIILQDTLHGVRWNHIGIPNIIQD